MKFLLHIVAKDFRGLRDRWVYWLGAMVIKTGAALWLVWGRGVDATTYDYVCKSLLVLVPTEVALTFLLTAMIVQADPLVGEQPFWRTRPISGARMLAAKMVSLFVLLGLPVCGVALPWWWACGGGLANIASVAVLMLLVQAAIMFPAVVVASVTDSLGRFFVWSLLVVTGFGVAGLANPLALVRPGPSEAALASSRLTAYFAVAVLTGVTVVVWQYVGRNRRVGYGLLAGGWLVALAAATWWPWSIDPTRWTGDSRGAAPLAKIEVEIDGTSIAPRALKANYDVVTMQLRVSGLPENVVLGVRRSEHGWRWPDGTVFRDFGTGLSSYQPMLEAVRRELRLPEPRDEVAWRAKYPDAGKSRVGLTMAHALTEKLRAGPPRYELKTELVVLRPRLGLEVPLRLAGWQARNGHGVRLIGESPGGPKQPVRVTYLHTEFPLRAADWLRTTFSSSGPDYGAAQWFWLDRATGQLKPLGSGTSSLRWVIAGVTVSLPLVSLDERDLRDAAVRGLSLVWVDWEGGTPFTRTMTAERFEVR